MLSVGIQRGHEPLEDGLEGNGGEVGIDEDDVGMLVREQHAKRVQRGTGEHCKSFGLEGRRNLVLLGMSLADIQDLG